MPSRVALILACAAFPVVFRLLLANWSVHPSPAVNDEFSYLLAADTFSLGRLTNPPHPMWKHFETFQELQRPTYASKYPPGQGMILAVGKVLFGDPLIGVWLSAGFMCGAICWMLQAWLPSRWVLVGVLLAITEYVIGYYWLESYWGGCLAASGGALVLGAIPRLLRGGRRFTIGLILGFGLSILALTRPFEGSLLTVAAGGVGAWLGIKAVKRGNDVLLKDLRISLIPAVIVVVGTLGFLIFYNLRVTGHPLEFPYMLHEHHYRRGLPLLRWQTFHGPLPTFNSSVLRDFYEYEYSLVIESKTWDGFVNQLLMILDIRWFWMLWRLKILLAALTLVMMPWLIRRRKLLLPLVCFWLVVMGLTLPFVYHEHYAAPITAIKILLAVEVVRYLSVGLRRRFRLWRFPVLIAGVLLLLIIRHGLSFGFLTDQRLWSLAVHRPRIIAELNRFPGKQLVMVRYESTHYPLDEWVYNTADIDQSKIVWARELETASNTKLLHYFHDRRVWLLKPDEIVPRLEPYQAVPLR